MAKKARRKSAAAGSKTRRAKRKTKGAARPKTRAKARVKSKSAPRRKRKAAAKARPQSVVAKVENVLHAVADTLREAAKLEEKQLPEGGRAVEE